jgi:protein LSM14
VQIAEFNFSRYVGTLHEINPEASTIALENVVSHGTEGRRGNPTDEIAASTSVYEYIVFRGSDVKDISVAEDKHEPTEPETPQMPDDPAILGVSSSSFLLTSFLVRSFHLNTLLLQLR